MIRDGRPSDVAGIARVHVQAWRETYSGMLPAGMIEAQSEEQKRSLWSQWLARTRPRGALLVACEQDRVVGFGNIGPAQGELAGRAQHQIYAIYLLRTAQGRGLGSSLMRRLARAMTDMQDGPVRLWVAEANLQARGFYEHLGGEVVARTVGEHFGFAVTEVAYNWPSCKALSAVEEGPGQSD